MLRHEPFGQLQHLRGIVRRGGFEMGQITVGAGVLRLQQQLQMLQLIAKRRARTLRDAQRQRLGDRQISLAQRQRQQRARCRETMISRGGQLLQRLSRRGLLTGISGAQTNHREVQGIHAIRGREFHRQRRLAFRHDRILLRQCE